ncbi:MAG TPA: transcription termination/antitermination protein NusG [Candidatus Avimonoglobus intestinipullorum]|uniref:Transcription termination/antitermination protein NusG n=1 Tax=Candidatus Avimonoglobus intestinipullorum TaxID=2840699 RepID=A0A9D1S5M3_9FIRM|nr:transcription termination/antitermination protein NusG [Candidatus Avimonoglobus intestinipullorum]
MAEEAKWFVVHTYSGYENKVKANIEKSVDNRGMQDLIQAVEVPLEDVIEEKNGEKKTVKRKVFPGYVVIKMVMTDESWYVVRNTRGVTGFVGPGSKPVPLSDEEVERMGVETVRAADLDVAVGDHVMVKSGPLEGFSGVIEEIQTERRKLIVKVSMFGRETPVEVDYNQVEHID